MTDLSDFAPDTRTVKCSECWEDIEYQGDEYEKMIAIYNHYGEHHPEKEVMGYYPFRTES